MNPLIEKAIQRIPSQLRRDVFRFVPIWSGEKKPFEPKWNMPGGNNYPYDHPKLAAFLIEGHNWGTCAGFGDLIIFDADEERLSELGIIDALPETFTVRTGGGGLHKYYICPNFEDKIIMFDRELKDPDGKPLHLGEIQTLGFQAVGPGSLHPNGKRYVVEEDRPIAEITWSQIYEPVAGKVDFGTAKAPRKKHFAVKVRDVSRRDPFEDLSIKNVIYPKGNVRKNGPVVQGSHPVHGSQHGYNFKIDSDENTWVCYRCGSGGGPALAIAMMEGLLRCDQCHKKALRGDLFVEVLKIAERRGYIKPRRPEMELEVYDL